MRYRSEHKSESRERLVRASGARAKENGFAASGIDDLADAAGLTSGAFYKHFGGKAKLLAAIVETELETTRTRFAAIDARDESQLHHAIDLYLSLGHVRHPEAGCILPTLAAEIARAPVETKSVYERALAELSVVLAEKVGDATIASGIVSLCAGAVMIARGLASDDAKRAVLSAARKNARVLLAR